MRHRVKNKKLGRKTTARLSMLLAQAEALIKNGKIKLTLERAKQLRRVVERLIGLSKYNTLSTRRKLESKFRGNRLMVQKTMELGSRYEGRPGGFTRIISYGRRRGDGAEMALIELV